MAVITATAIAGSAITAGTVAAGAATALAVGGTVASASAQKKGAKAAAGAYQGLQYNPTKSAKELNENMGFMFGRDEQGRGYEEMRQLTNANTLQRLGGEVSLGTQDQLRRSALATAAPELGPAGVDQMYAGYLGLTSEQLSTQGQQEFQSLFTMYDNAVQNRATAQYTADLNAANAKAAGIAGKYNAQASMWSGLAGIAGAFAGGGFGGGSQPRFDGYTNFNGQPVGYRRATIV